MKTFDGFAIPLVAALALVPTAGRSAEPAKGAVRYRFVAQEVYKPGSPMPVAFELTNLSSEPVWVLQWYTPLEGLWGKILKVTRDGAPVAYRGPMAKRGPINKDDYVRIEPGKAAREEVDLSVPYDLSTPGTYRVEFLGPIHDLSRDEGSLPRGVEAQQPADAVGDPATFKVEAK